MIEQEEVVVTPGYFPEKLQQNCISSGLQMDQREIAKTPGAPDVFRRLQSIAGVVRAADNSPQLVVRGGSPSENLTIIENIEIFSPFHFASLGSGMENGLSIIEPRLIENAVLLTGGFSSKYGDRLSSVAEITLRDPDKIKITGDAYVNFGGFGSFFTGPLNNNVSWMISARRGIWDLMAKMRDADATPRTIDVHSKIIAEPAKGHALTLSAIYVQDEVISAAKEEPGFTVANRNTHIVKDVLASGLTWRWLYSTKGFLSATGYVNKNLWKSLRGPDNEKDRLGYESREDFYGLKITSTYQLSRSHEFLLGVDMRNIDAEYTKWSGLDTTRTGLFIQPYRIEFGPQSTYKIAAFLDYTIRFFPWMKGNVGVRGDYFRFTDDQVISPRLGLSIDPTEESRVYVQYGQFTQFPAFNTIFLNSLNSNLATSKATHYILGAEYLLASDLQLKAEFFYKDLENLAVAETDTSTLYRSTGTGYAEGIECTLTKKMSDDIYILANYTYSKSRRNDASGTSDYDFEYDSPHMFNLMTTYKHNTWWEFGVIFRYATGLPYTPYDLSTRRYINGTWYAEKDPKSFARYPDYLRLDVRIDRRFVFNSWNLDVYIELWNLTNHTNVVSYNYSTDFLTTKAMTIFQFMPMIGIAAEF